jgi:hypothetical protein
MTSILLSTFPHESLALDLIANGFRYLLVEHPHNGLTGHRNTRNTGHPNMRIAGNRNVECADEQNQTIA